MAVGRFTGYQPLPDMPGAYSFQTNGGPPLTFGGPQAEQLKARLDAANAQTRTAGAGAGGFEQADPGAGVNPFSGKPYGAPADQPPASIARQSPADEALTRNGGRVQVSPGVYRTADGRIFEEKRVAGSAGVTKEQLAEKDANATAVRTGATEVRQEGPGVNQEYLDTRSALTQAESDNLKKREADDIAAAREESRIAAQQFQRVQAQQAEEASRVADLERKYAVEEQAKNKAFADYTSSKVEPDRVFSNPLAGIARIIAQAGGAWAATMGKSPNFAQQVIDQTIDRDIRAQEAAIKLKGEKANNLLSDLRQRGMSVEQARAAAKGIQAQHAAAQLAALRAKNAVPALENHYNNLQVGLSKSANQADEDYRLQTVPKVTQSTNKTFVQEKAPTAGGVVTKELTGKDALAYLGNVQNLEAGDIKNQKDRRDLAAGPKGAAASPEQRMAAGAQAEADVLRPIAGKYPTDKEVATYESQWFGGRLAEDFANYVAGNGAGVSPETAQERQDFSRVQAGLGAAAAQLGGQGSMTGDEQKTFAAGMAPGATWGEVQRATEMLADRARARGRAAEQVGEAGGTVVTK